MLFLLRKHECYIEFLAQIKIRHTVETLLLTHGKYRSITSVDPTLQAITTREMSKPTIHRISNSLYKIC